MKNRSTSIICGENIRNRCQVLHDALKNPTEVSSKIFEACQSQSLLASMSLPSHTITPLSRNSLYKYANLELTNERIPTGYKDEGRTGYKYLDWLRNEVKKIRKELPCERSKSARASRAEQRLQELSHQVDELRKHSLAISKAYLYLFTSLKGLHADESVSATTRQRIAILMNDHDRLYSDLFAEVGTLRPDNLEIF